MAEEQEKKQRPQQAPKPAQMASPKPAQAQDANFRHLVRVCNTDMPGSKHVVLGLTTIKGVSIMLSHAICTVTKIDGTRKTGSLSEAEALKLEEAIKNPMKHGIPRWMLNRRKDYDTGADLHLIGNDWDYTIETDIKRMKKAKTYKGLRHHWGLPVRGQRTKSNFRKNKGKAMGVKKPKVGKKQ